MEPSSTTIGRIDQGDRSSTGRVARWLGQPGRHRVGAHRKRPNDDRPMLADLLLRLIAVEDQQPGHDASGLPTTGPSGRGREALVPADLPFDPTEVKELGLDFDHQQGAGRRVEREDVDPPAVPAVHDGHLSRDLPSERQQSSLDVSGAPGVDRVSGGSDAQERWSAEAEIDLQSKGVGDRRKQVEGRACDASLDLGQVAPADPGERRDFGLRDVKPGPRISKRSPKGHPQRGDGEGGRGWRSWHVSQPTRRRSTGGYRSLIR
jgi:hypothetical protein